MNKKVNFSGEKSSCFSHGIRKKAISAVVATVLIILITVAAVTIIWTAVIPMIKNQASFENELINLDIETAEGYTVYDGDSSRLIIQVRRGSDDVVLSGMKIIVYSGGNSESKVVDVLAPNSARVYYYTYSGVVDSIAVVPIYADGKEGTITATIDSVPSSDLSELTQTFEDFGETSTPDPFTALVNGAVSFYNFDDGTADDVLERNDGILGGGAIIVDGGKFGKGLSLDGVGDYVTITDSDTVLDFWSTKNYTWSVWLKPEPFVNTLGCWISKDALPAKPKGFNLCLHGAGTFYPYKIDNNGALVAGSPSIGTGMSVGKFYHVVVVYRGEGEFELYVNGTSKGVSALDAYSDTLASYYIGAGSKLHSSSQLPDYYWNGSIDEVMIFNRTLTEEEITTIYEHYPSA